MVDGGAPLAKGTALAGQRNGHEVVQSLYSHGSSWVDQIQITSTTDPKNRGRHRRAKRRDYLVLDESDMVSDGGLTRRQDA